ncbi:hypothetical protein ANCCEY_03298 [Ancylostoma ceylanicum]|uniref:7TM GPCR serpentine receptor class x (Srx) domain-containing protein n=1 Tax=Ancylostoma ceylanicum TaxID=53326 RepID=A0A0D6M5D8_9BILA|nr:hypothetical protein ANCCEY_03298 [Ancylostoma ceylanicum]
MKKTVITSFIVCQEKLFSSLIEKALDVSSGLNYFPISFTSEDCSMYFNSEDMLFYFAKTECGELVAFYGDFLTGVSMFTVCLVMDLVSILYLRRARKRVGNSLAIGKKKERFKREVVMTVQTFINTSLFYIMVFSYHYAYALFSACPLVVFLSTNFLWSVVIASGGYTAVFINKDLRGTLMHPSRLYGRKLTSESILTHRTPCPTELIEEPVNNTRRLSIPVAGPIEVAMSLLKSTVTACMYVYHQNVMLNKGHTFWERSDAGIAMVRDFDAREAPNA